MRQVLLSRMKKTTHAGGKAKLDVRDFVTPMGYRPVDMSNEGTDLQKGLRSVGEVPRIVRHTAPLRGADVLVCQFPLGQVADRLATANPAPLKVAIVHDLESLRQQDGSTRDTALLARYDAVVAHGPAMGAWLRERLPQRTAVVELGMFDYVSLAERALPAPADRPERLYLVGMLRPDKVAYLYDLTGTAVPIDIFGPECSPELLPDGVTHRGLIDVDHPVPPARDGFGLVWDGASPDGLAGAAGDYLRFNAPHKLSFYIAAGLPVVVSDESAMADFVTDHGVGVCVPSVYAGAEAVAACSAEQWQSLCSAVDRLREEVLDGAHTQRAVTAAVAAARAARSTGA